jgi:hypothetical protein
VIKKSAECAMPDFPSRPPTAEKENAVIPTNSDSRNKSRVDQFKYIILLSLFFKFENRLYKLLL